MTSSDSQAIARGIRFIGIILSKDLDEGDADCVLAPDLRRFADEAKVGLQDILKTGQQKAQEKSNQLTALIRDAERTDLQGELFNGDGSPRSQLDANGKLVPTKREFKEGEPSLFDDTDDTDDTDGDEEEDDGGEDGDDQLEDEDAGAGVDQADDGDLGGEAQVDQAESGRNWGVTHSDDKLREQICEAVRDGKGKFESCNFVAAATDKSREEVRLVFEQMEAEQKLTRNSAGVWWVGSPAQELDAHLAANRKPEAELASAPGDDVRGKLPLLDEGIAAIHKAAPPNPKSAPSRRPIHAFEK